MPTSLDLYAPYDAGPGSDAREDTWRKMMRHLHGGASGVLRGFANEFGVFADSTGMQVKVRTGECWIRGQWGESTTEKTLTIGLAHATWARWDRVILRNDFLNNRIELDILPGTAAASPAKPTLTQSTTIWETSLALVNIPANDLTIDAAQVTDDRNYTTVQVRVRQASVQNIPNTTITKILYDTVSAGSDSSSSEMLYDTTNRSFNVGRAGLWMVATSFRFASNVTGYRGLYIAKSGLENTDRLGASIIGANGFEALNCVAVNRFGVGDQICIYAQQTSGIALNSDTAAMGVNASLMWVGP